MAETDLPQAPTPGNFPTQTHHRMMSATNLHTLSGYPDDTTYYSRLLESFS
jgi:hypothetical protein